MDQILFCGKISEPSKDTGRDRMDMLAHPKEIYANVMVL
jgi:hypothetical protein